MSFHENELNESSSPEERKPTKGQIRCLIDMGVTIPRGLTYSDADRLIKENPEKRDMLPPTPKQEGWLKSNNLWRDGMKRGEADAIIGMFMPQDRQRY
jgi:hypothetical protein